MIGKVVQRTLFGGDEEIVAKPKRGEAAEKKRREKDAPRAMLIETVSDGGRTKVEGKAEEVRCSLCASTSCWHAKVGMDVLFGDGKGPGGLRYVCKSGFHKELRRGDLATARLWAHWFVRFWGKSAPLNYLRKIWSEETCSLALMRRLDQKETTVDEAILAFAGATKIWELPAAMEMWLAFDEGGIAFDAEEIGAEWSEMSDDEVVALAPCDDPRLFAALLRELGRRDNEQATHLALRARKRQLKFVQERGAISAEDAAAFDRRYVSGRFEAEDRMLFMLLAGTYTAETDVLREVPLPANWDQEPVLPFPRAYVHDYHTRRGKADLEKWEQRTGRRLALGVEIYPLDYRFAGGGIPMLWRWMAWQQHGTLDVKWTQVVVTDEVRSIWKRSPRLVQHGD
jgi:hypothetical protein